MQNPGALKILLVDDRSENLLALESLLRQEGVEFHRALTGMQALELLLRHDFALALVDVQMPEMNGLELAEYMRGTEETRGVPIIFVTAGTRDQMNTFKGYEKGAVDYLYKPLDPLIVKSKVHVFLELAKQRMALEFQLQETERVLAERDHALKEAREALITRDEFMSIASHELKTPLTSIHLQHQIIMRSLKKEANTPLTEKLMGSMQVCERQSAKLAGLLDELLDLTRVRLGKLELNKEPVDLSLLVKEVLTLFQAEFRAKHYTVDFEAPSTLIGQWDRFRIEQVMTNLISNAIKYGEGRPLDVKVTRDPNGSHARVTVTDQGMGVSEEMQGKIFKRFERAVAGKNISGLGLGLYITRQIVDAHGGKISIQSELRKGSTFEVKLPLSDPGKITPIDDDSEE